jgi:exonuclease SbcD
MKFIHISDLHIGRKLNEISLLDDQIHILNQILNHLDTLSVDAVLISGDVYDKSIPPAEAVGVLDAFLTSVSERNIPVFIISGNHDSQKRLGFGKTLLRKSNIFIASDISDTLQKHTLSDEFGEVDIYLLPFVRPEEVKVKFNCEDISTTQEAITAIIRNTLVSDTRRNVLLAHQFVIGGTTPPETCRSETIYAGGTDHVDVSVFDAFDYVALGHLHRAQRIGRETVRYCGSPLKYSFSEATHKKSMTLVEIKEKGNITIRLIPLQPIRDLREIKGPIQSLIQAGREDTENCEDYISAILTDEDELMEPFSRLKSVYPNLLQLSVENSATKARFETDLIAATESDISPEHLFMRFFEQQYGRKPTSDEERIIKEVFILAAKESE